MLNAISLVSPCPFPTTITITPQASPQYICSIYKKVILVDERQQNDFKSFAKKYKVQIDTRRKYSQFSFRVDATGLSSG